MPELPEVQTTVDGLNRYAKGRRIVSLSTTYESAYHKGKDNIKDPKFFRAFKRKVVGQKILGTERRAKNVLIHLSPASPNALPDKHTIIVHMKMTGHFVYDRPDYPHARLSLMLDNGKVLSLSDMRKFAKVTLVKTSELKTSPHLKNLGPEPLDEKFKYSNFKFRIIMRPKGKIKQVLMNPAIIAGIGNIYADEILWRSDVHPFSVVEKIPETNLKRMYRAMREVLTKGIALGGDSMSDYRNIRGERGKFQEHHRAYRRTGKPCAKRGSRQSKESCQGTIARAVLGARSAHFCPVHQTLFQ
jgi:formamidopyrimidine-DNA glycosylase